MERRKLFVLCAVVVVFVLGHWDFINAFVRITQVDVAAHWIQHEYLTGTAIVILLALVFLLPERAEE